jgi:alanine dehydrogenase
VLGWRWPLRLARLALYLTEADVGTLVTPQDALEAVEGSFLRLARGEVENRPRSRMRVEGGVFALMAAVDHELGFAGLKSYAWVREGTPFVVVLFDLRAAVLAAVIEADKLGQLRTGAASGVAAARLAKPGASSLGVIGCGWQAESQVACIRAAVPTIKRVVAYCRTEGRLREFCRRVDAEAGESHRDAGEQEIVVTATTSKDPVLRGEWLRPGALVCAIGANEPRARELDNVVLERAAFVCCDSREQSRLESGDLIEPVESGVLDWLEVHELQEVVAGDVTARQSDDDIVLFKSNGIAAWDVAIGAAALEKARAQGVGKDL